MSTSEDVKKIGRFEIVSPLGQGGMGYLYLARDPAIDRFVAIKVMRDGAGDEEARGRFEREARSAGRLQHPNIVTIFEVGEVEGAPYIAMEYIAGETWAELTKRRASLTLVRKLQMLEELCAGLHFAHESGIVHRDIKPANVMVDSKGGVKILDFGIARLADSGMTQTGMLMGTLSYMSPEQLSGQKVDFRSDIFAVGAVAYELLTGQRAFAGGIDQGLIHRVLSEAPPSPRNVDPSIPVELERLLLRALQKDPASRFSSLAEMQSALRDVRSDLSDPGTGPTVSRPLDGSARLGKHEQVEASLAKGQRAFATGDFEEALAFGRQAADLDPSDQRAADLVDLSQTLVEKGRVRQWVNEARAHLDEGAVTAAGHLVEQVLAIDAVHVEALTLKAVIRQKRRDLEQARERADVVRATIARGQASLEQGAVEAAERAATEILAIDAANSAARRLREMAIAQKAGRPTTATPSSAASTSRDRRAVIEARRLFAGGHQQAALDLLEGFAGTSEVARTVLEELRFEREQIEARRTERGQRMTVEAETVPAPPTERPVQVPRAKGVGWKIAGAAAAVLIVAVGGFRWLVHSPAPLSSPPAVIPAAAPPARGAAPEGPEVQLVEHVAANPVPVGTPNAAVMPVGDGRTTGSDSSAVPVAPPDSSARARTPHALGSSASSSSNAPVPARDPRPAGQVGHPGATSVAESPKGVSATEPPAPVAASISRSLAAAATIPSGETGLHVGERVTLDASPAPSAPPTLPVAAMPSRATPTPAPVPDDAAIRRVLTRYASAYARLDVREIRAVYTGLSDDQAERLEKTFADYKAYDLQLGDVAVTVTGTTAVAICTATHVFSPKAGRAGSRTTDARFELRKGTAGWEIAAVGGRR